LAVYLECELYREGILEASGPIVVDCEYNRHIDGVKKHRISQELRDIVSKAKRKAKRTSDDAGYYVFSVAPDIVVHKRGDDSLNLLVVEVKKLSNREIREYDDLKLNCFTKQGDDEYGYDIGFVVIADDIANLPDRKLKLSTQYPRPNLRVDGIGRKSSDLI
jgi:hypothetical protein